MGAGEARGALENVVLTKLQERGWTVTEASRRGIDLDLKVERHGTPGAVRFRNAFEVSGRDAASAESNPTWFRVDLGTPAGEPERWAVWDRYSFPSGRSAPRYRALVVHEAIGDGWASVSGCSVAPGTIWRERVEAVDLVLSRAEALAPHQAQAARRERIFEMQRQNFGAQTPRGRQVVIAAVLLGVAFLIAAAGADAWPSATDVPRFVAMLLVCGLPVVVLALVALVMLAGLARRGRGPLEGMDVIREALRCAGAFGRPSLSARKERDGLPVVFRSGFDLRAGAAPLSVSRLGARSSSVGLILEADLCSLSWPEGVAPEARFVPDRWLTVDLRGAEAVLAKLPPGPREERRPGLLRWTFTGPEIDAGHVADHLRAVAGDRASAASPYR
jgi:hypothetical protein